MKHRYKPFKYWADEQYNLTQLKSLLSSPSQPLPSNPGITCTQFFEYLAYGAPAVLDFLADQLTLKDLKSLRCCAKGFEEILIRFVFRGDDTLVVSQHPPDIKVAEAVMKNPLLRGKVHHVLWDISYFDPSLLCYQWYELHSPENKIDPLKLWHEWSQPVDFNTKLVEQALSLPSLKTFRINQLLSFTHRAPDQLIFEWAVMGSVMVSPAARSFQNFYGVVQLEVGSPENSKYVAPDEFANGQRVSILSASRLRAVLSIVSALNVPLTELYITSMSGLDEDIWLEVLPSFDISQLALKFSSLRFLTLRLSCHGSNTDHKRLAQYVLDLFPHMPDLQYYHHTIKSLGPFFILRLPEHSIHQPYVPYRHLKQLKFACGNYHTGDLHRFIQLHLATLEMVQLEYVTLIDGSWRTFLSDVCDDAEMFATWGGTITFKLNNVDDHIGSFLRSGATAEIVLYKGTHEIREEKGLPAASVILKRDLDAKVIPPAYLQALT